MRFTIDAEETKLSSSKLIVRIKRAEEGVKSRFLVFYFPRVWALTPAVFKASHQHNIVTW